MTWAHGGEEKTRTRTGGEEGSELLSPQQHPLIRLCAFYFSEAAFPRPKKNTHQIYPIVSTRSMNYAPLVSRRDSQKERQKKRKSEEGKSVNECLLYVNLAI